MDERRRRQYLRAMGIPQWVFRGRSVAPEAPVVEKVGEDSPRVSRSGSTHSTAERVEAQCEPPSWVLDDVPASESSCPAGMESVSPGAGRHAERIAAMGWEPLREVVASCDRCTLHATRTQAVFGVGNPDAAWMIVGEAPGVDEDRQGEPFVGRAGKLLDKMLMAVGLERSKVFIANVLKCRPPQNRDPTEEECGACRPYLERQIELVNPQVILSVGRISAHNLLGCDSSVGRLRGAVHRFGAKRIPLVVTYHPAYLLRRPIEKRKAWEDLKLAMSASGNREA